MRFATLMIALLAFAATSGEALNQVLSPNQVVPETSFEDVEELQVKTGFGSGDGSGTPTSLPACVNPIGFNAGYGPCNTYAAGQGNANWCASDTHAERDCAECGKCSGSGTQPTKQPTQYATQPTYGYGSGSGSDTGSGGMDGFDMTSNQSSNQPTQYATQYAGIGSGSGSGGAQLQLTQYATQYAGIGSGSGSGGAPAPGGPAQGSGFGSGFGSDTGSGGMDGFDMASNQPTNQPTLSPTGNGTPTSLPACVNPIGFNAGYGPCNTYAAGQGNANWCAFDTHAERDCAECGECSGSGTQPTKQPTQYATQPTYGYGSGSGSGSTLM